MNTNLRFKYILGILSLCAVLSCKLKNSASQVTAEKEKISKPNKNGNPLVYDVGMADPHIKIYNDKAYLYATRDEDKTSHKFVMPDWKIWSSDDLINWTLETTIDPTETYMGVSKNCWAPDVAAKNGKYYFYFSNGNKDTGVMVGETPTGKFKDALGEPLLPQDMTIVKEYDPSVIIDDDGEAYIIFGHHRSDHPDFYYMIAKLNEDMISLAESPKEVLITGDVEVLGGNDKPNLHKRNGIYYLSAGSHYAIAKNIYGPYVKTGNSGNENYGLTDRAHGNYFSWNNQDFHTWCHFHLGKEVARYRESYISYLHYKDNGEMVTDTDFLDAHFSMGVGQYDANWDRIQAEWYMKSENIEKKENQNGGFEIQTANSKGALFFPNVYNIENKNVIEFYVTSDRGGVIEIYNKDADGKLLGTCKFSDTQNNYKMVSCKIENTEGVKDVFIQLQPKKEGFLNLDWFVFKK